MVTPPVDDVTEECNAADVNDSSKRSSGTYYYQDLEGKWTKSIHCAFTNEDEKELTDAGVELAKTTLQDNPSLGTHQGGIHTVTPLALLKSSFLLPMVQGILPAFLSLLLAAKPLDVFTQVSLDNLVDESNVVFQNFSSVLGCYYVKVIHQTIEWWNMKIAWCLQHCKDTLVLAFACRVLQQIWKLKRWSNTLFCIIFW